MDAIGSCLYLHITPIQSTKCVGNILIVGVDHRIDRVIYSIFFWIGGNNICFYLTQPYTSGCEDMVFWQLIINKLKILL